MIEPSRPMAQAAEKLCENAFKTNWCRNILELSRITSRASAARFDLVLATFALSELPSDDARSLALDILWESVAPGGLLLLLERGNDRGSKIVAKGRQQIIDGGSVFDLDSVSKKASTTDAATGKPIPTGCHVIAPCGHNDKCPLLDAKRDDMSALGISSKKLNRKPFCHFSQATERLLTPSARIANEHVVSYSYAAIKKLASRDEEIPSMDYYRILRAPVKNQGHVVLDLCVPEHGIVRETITRRDRQRYSMARKAKWGGMSDVSRRTMHRFEMLKLGESMSDEDIFEEEGGGDDADSGELGGEDEEDEEEEGAGDRRDEVSRNDQ